MSLPASCKVLIIGAGPTGLMLANQLGRRGVGALIIDQNPGPSIATKALGVQARTLEIYAQLGIAGKALELGTRAAGANVWVDGRRAARVPLGDIGRALSPFPFLLILGQDDNERLLGHTLLGFGTKIHWSTKLTGLVQNGERVIATLSQDDGSMLAVRADWVAGCDGAHSAVRSLNHIDFPGAPYEHTFYVADTRATGSMVPGELNIHLGQRGFHLFFPMRQSDHWRIVGILPPELQGRDDLTFESVEPSIRMQAGASISVQACNWFSSYRIHHRRAARFRHDRCFLLGDAAHIHSPVGAQGMNTGLQDAYNLGWKLAWVCNGHAGARLLDSYEIERIPVADRLLKTTDRAFSAVVSNGWLAKTIRTRIAPEVLAFAMRFDKTRKLAFRTISQIGVRYPGSPLSQGLTVGPGRGPAAGDRFPWLILKFSPDGDAEDLFDRLEDSGLNLILIGQQPLPVDSPGLDDPLCIHRIPEVPFNIDALAQVNIPIPAFYLLRPDGHIGLAGARLDTVVLRQYLLEMLYLAPVDSRRP